MSGKVSASVRYSRVSKPLSPVTMRPLSCEATPLGLRRNARSFLSVQCGSAISHAPRDAIHRSMLVTLAWFSPIEPARAQYRLAALEAVAAAGDMLEDDDEDKHWNLAMKGGPPGVALIKRGTVWSRRLVHNRVRAPQFEDGTTLPIRVQCRDASGGGLDPDEEIPFAIAVTLQVAATAQYDVHEEIRDQLLVRLRGDGLA